MVYSLNCSNFDGKPSDLGRSHLRCSSVCCYRDNEEDDTCSPETAQLTGQRFRPLMTLKQRRRSLLNAVYLPIQIPNHSAGGSTDGPPQPDSGVSGSPLDRWKRAVKQVHSLPDPWAKLNLDSLPTEQAKRYRYSALKKKWVTDDVSVKMENEVCRFRCKSCLYRT